jgi:hypothetical protein
MKRKDELLTYGFLQGYGILNQLFTESISKRVQK